MSENPHLAGTDADYKQAKELQEFWRSAGLDEAFITPYDILLSYPETQNESMMNQIFVYNSADQEVWKSALYEPILDPSENKSNVVPPFNAYSASGDVNSVRMDTILFIQIIIFKTFSNSIWLEEGKNIFFFDHIDKVLCTKKNPWSHKLNTCVKKNHIHLYNYIQD